MEEYPRLIAAVAHDNYDIMLSYADGQTRVYNFAKNLTHKYYKPLADIALFKQVKATDGEIEWPTGQDFCPHTLYNDSILVD
jgi:hypothetical protein